MLFSEAVLWYRWRNMALFGGKKKQETAAQIPVEQVSGLRQQGYSNDQIIQSLQGQGFKSSQIFDALSQADASAPQEGAGMDYGANMQQQQPDDQQQQGYPQQYAAQGYPQSQGAPLDKDEIEEVAEAIIDEKWKDFMKDVAKAQEAIKANDIRLTRIEQDIKNLRENFDSLHNGVLGKISEYDQNLTNVGVEIKAMEKVFQKILPTFTENVNKLSRYTESIPSPKKK